MDAVTLVITALVTGLTMGTTEMARTTVMDIYQSLKTRLQSKVEDREDAQSALAEVERKPASEGRKLILKEELENLEIARDSELVALARKFLETVDQKGANTGKYVITINDSYGIVIGDNNTVQQNAPGRGRKKQSED